MLGSTGIERPIQNERILIAMHICAGRASKRGTPVKHWEVIADNLSKAGWSWGCVSAIDSHGRTIWILDSHRGETKRFVVRVDEKLAAFLELEAAICACGE